MNWGQVISGATGAMQGSLVVRDKKKAESQANALATFTRALQSDDDAQIDQAFSQLQGVGLSQDQIQKVSGLIDSRKSRDGWHS